MCSTGDNTTADDDTYQPLTYDGLVYAFISSLNYYIAIICLSCFLAQRIFSLSV